MYVPCRDIFFCTEEAFCGHFGSKNLIAKILWSRALERVFEILSEVALLLSFSLHNNKGITTF